MNMGKKIICAAMTVMIIAAGTFAYKPIEAYAAAPVVVVIDPGHGGTNEGAKYSGRLEKNMTLVIANAMYEELSKYEGITVYMTRTADVELSLVERAAFAQSVGADFLYSLHLNASNSHRLFGSEVWTSAYGNYYSKGQSFGAIEEEQLEAMGIYSRGIKTKLKGSGNGDYYGIINNSRARGIPAVIIEHCHMDIERDLNFASTDAKLRELGKADATAVAKYYGLKSTKLGVDYSGYQKISVAAPAGAVGQDTTAPEICNATLVSYDSSKNQAVIKLQASDSNSKILYYDYSLDGGMTFTPLAKWTPGTDTGEVTIKTAGGSQNVIMRVTNQYELTTSSAPVKLY